MEVTPELKEKGDKMKEHVSQCDVCKEAARLRFVHGITSDFINEHRCPVGQELYRVYKSEFHKCDKS